MSYFLFACPSFKEGVARIVDFGNSLQVYNVSRDGDEADRRAFQADWDAVAGDMQQAMNKVEREVIHRRKPKK